MITTHLKPTELTSLVLFSASGSGYSNVLLDPHSLVHCVYLVGHQKGFSIVTVPLSQTNVNSFGRSSSVDTETNEKLLEDHKC